MNKSKTLLTTFVALCAVGMTLNVQARGQGGGQGMGQGGGQGSGDMTRARTYDASQSGNKTRTQTRDASQTGDMQQRREMRQENRQTGQDSIIVPK